MELGFDVRTGFLLLGLLSLASAAGGYATLRASLHRGNLLWLATGLCFGAGGLMLALRGSIPNVLSFELAHGCLVGGLVGQALAVHQEGRPSLRQGRRTLLLAFGGALCSVVAFAYVRRLDVVWGIAYFALAVGVAALAVMLAALGRWRVGRQRGAAIIALTFVVLAAAMVVRIVSVLSSAGAEPAFEPGLNQVTMLAAAFFTLVLGQVGYLGLQFERIAKGRVATARQAAILAERAQQTQLREAALHALVEERNQLIQRLARHETASDLARFAMDLPHELSQPLCVIKLDLEALMTRLQGAEQDPTVARTLHSIETSNDRVMQQLQQLRILLADHDASDHRDVELGSVIARTQPILEGSFRDQNVALARMTAPYSVWVRGSATQLQQLLLILCLNALSLRQLARRGEGTQSWVRIGLAREGDRAVLTVEDGGAARAGREVASERVDVGLAIATRIAQAHDGVLAAVSGASPGATLFRLSLPAIAPPQ